MDNNAQRAIPATEEKVEERFYRGELCPVVKFNNGPFRNRIYVRYRGSLVHVGNRTMKAVKIENNFKSNPGSQEKFMNTKDNANGTGT